MALPTLHRHIIAGQAMSLDLVCGEKPQPHLLHIHLYTSIDLRIDILEVG